MFCVSNSSLDNSFNIHDFYNLIFSGSENYLGYVNVIKRTGYKFSLVRSIPYKDAADFVENDLFIYHGSGYFYTKNFSKKIGSWNSNDTFSLNNIIIDVDAHHDSISKEVVEQKRDILPLLYGNLALYFEDLGFAAPNAIVFTGRGYQIVWHIESLPAKEFSRAYEKVVRKYIQILDQYICEKDSFLSGFKVDTGASIKVQGLYRLPESYNPSAKTYTSLYMGSAIAIDFLKEYDNLSKYEKRDTVLSYVVKKNSGHLAEARRRMIEELFSLRGYDIEVGIRNQSLFTYGSILSGCKMGYQDILEALESVNQKMSTPLREAEIKSIAKSVSRKLYKFSNQKIIENLDMSEDEQKKLHFYAGKKNHTTEKRKATTRKKREDRNSCIIRFFSRGVNRSEIARILKISRPTVIKVIKAFLEEQKEVRCRNIEIFQEALRRKADRICRQVRVGRSTVLKRVNARQFLCVAFNNPKNVELLPVLGLSP